MQNIPSSCLEGQNFDCLDVFDRIVDNIVSIQKVPKFTYSTLLEKCLPDMRICFGQDLSEEDPEDLDWEDIHLHNLKCSIDSRLRSFYFKVFHNANAFENFLFRIKRKESPNCVYCNNFTETITHFFCDCDIVKPIWKDLVELIRDKHDSSFTISSFDKIFGFQDDKFLTYLFLCMKYYLYVYKFQSKRPNFTNLIVFIKNKRDTEYYIAKKHDKLSLHFKKWRFDL